MHTHTQLYEDYIEAGADTFMPHYFERVAIGPKTCENNKSQVYM